MRSFSPSHFPPFSGTQDPKLVARDLTNAVALDFDYQDQMIYWSDVTSTASTISRMIYHKNVTENLKTKKILHDLTVKNPDGLGRRDE